MVTIDHIQIRYRQADPSGPWTYATIPPGQGSIQLEGFDRSAAYDFEARSVAASGAVSAWITQAHTVDSTSLGPSAPINPVATSIASGIQVSWQINGTQAPNVTYEVYEAASGSAPDSGWTLVGATTSTELFEYLSDTNTHYYRVRAVDYSGLASDYTVVVHGAVPQPTPPAQ